MVHQAYGRCVSFLLVWLCMACAGSGTEQKAAGRQGAQPSSRESSASAAGKPGKGKSEKAAGSGTDTAASTASASDQHDAAKGGPSDDEGGDGTIPDGAPPSTSSDTEGTGPVDEAEDEDQTSPGDGEETSPEGGGASAGERYFEDSLLPLFNKDCAVCHADPRMNPPVRGPLTIFSYKNMRALLSDGASAADNAMARKVRGVTTHGGGNRCNAGPNTSPCLELQEWWRAEFGNAADSGFDGRITSVSDTGDVLGYVVDTRDTAKVLTVRLFVDGVFAVETMASLSGADGNYPGDHAFRVTLPAALRDGKSRTVQAKVGEVAVGTALGYVAYAPKDAAKAYYTNTVAPVLNGRCSGCHVVQYEVQYGALISPTPAKGGTVTDNTLINYAAGMNAHPGGNVCGGKNGSPCNLFQTWWNMEFASSP